MSDHPAIDPSPRARLTGNERRETIVAAARVEFARMGFHGASTASIARAAGCSEPMLYKHFSNKQALFAAVLAHASSVFEAGIERILDQPGDPAANWRATLPQLMRDPIYVQILRLRGLSITIIDDPVVRSTLEGIQQRQEQRVRDVVEAAQAFGSIRADVDPGYVAWVWLGVMFSATYRDAVEPGGFAKMQPVVETFLDSLLA